MGSPYLALDIRDAGDVYDLADGAFYFKWSGKWADFVGVGDIGDDACFRVQPTLLDGVDSIKVVDGATLSTLDIPDPGLLSVSVPQQGERLSNRRKTKTTF